MSFAKGLYGTQFPTNNSSFSLNTMFVNLGFILGYLCSIYMCTRMKIIVNIAITSVSFVTYTTLIVKNSYMEGKKMQMKLKPADEQADEDQTLFLSSPSDKAKQVVQWPLAKSMAQTGAFSSNLKLSITNNNNNKENSKD